MPDTPLVLGFDTSAAHCAAALLSGPSVLAVRAATMTRGQAEALFPMLEDLLAEARTKWRDLDRIAVGIGPGNFTGIRIAVSAARGLSLSLGVPAIGVSTFDALRSGRPAVSVRIPAPRDMAYISVPGQAPRLMPADEATQLAPEAVGMRDPAELATAIARTALDIDPAHAERPRPFYLRPADAALPRDPPPRIIP